VWLSLSPPQDGCSPEALAQAAVEAKAPIDVSSQPAVWGEMLRGSDNPLIVKSDHSMEVASDGRHAADLTDAHLIQTLSCLGRNVIDFYFLRIRRAPEEFALSGALEAIDGARQAGHVKYLGICCDGPALATLGVWQFHDAFDVLLVPRNHYSQETYKTLAPLAKERRVGIITSHPLDWGFGLDFTRLPEHWKLRNLTQSFYGLTLAQAVIHDLAREHPVCVSVNSREEIRLAITAPDMVLPDGLNAMLEPFVESFNDESQWARLLASDEPSLKAAALRRANGSR
jgi:hypothetical protein